MGRTNDAIIYGGIVQLYVDAPEDEIMDLSKSLPSSNSKDYGKPFKDVFENYNKLLSNRWFIICPTCVIINSIKSGKSYSSGQIDWDLIKTSFIKCFQLEFLQIFMIGILKS